MDSVQIALYVLAAPIILGVGFLLWALYRLEIDKKHHRDSLEQPANLRRLRH